METFVTPEQRIAVYQAALDRIVVFGSAEWNVCPFIQRWLYDNYPQYWNDTITRDMIHDQFPEFYQYRGNCGMSHSWFYSNIERAQALRDCIALLSK